MTEGAKVPPAWKLADASILLAAVSGYFYVLGRVAQYARLQGMGLPDAFFAAPTTEIIKDGLLVVLLAISERWAAAVVVVIGIITAVAARLGRRPTAHQARLILLWGACIAAAYPFWFALTIERVLTRGDIPTRTVQNEISTVWFTNQNGVAESIRAVPVTYGNELFGFYVPSTRAAFVIPKDRLIRIDREPIKAGIKSVP